MNLSNLIVFYKVDLVCNVVTSIGCGSRFKPILFALENEESIKEVKLNRKGDTLAVNWYNDNINFRLEIMKSVFSKFNHIVKTINVHDRKKYLDSLFYESDNWLDAAHIDELSREEAEEVAKQLIAVYKAEANLNSNQKTRLKKDIVIIFYDFFLNFESMQQLSDSNIYRKLVIRVIETSKNYIHSGETPEIEMLLNAIGGHHENKDPAKCCN